MKSVWLVAVQAPMASWLHMKCDSKEEAEAIAKKIGYRFYSAVRGSYYSIQEVTFKEGR